MAQKLSGRQEAPPHAQGRCVAAWLSFLIEELSPFYHRPALPAALGRGGLRPPDSAWAGRVLPSRFCVRGSGPAIPNLHREKLTGAQRAPLPAGFRVDGAKLRNSE